MLNKIWASLIILGLSYAFAQDVYDELNDTYNNNSAVRLAYTINESGTHPLSIQFNKHTLAARLKKPSQIIIYLNEESPQTLIDIANANGNTSELSASVLSRTASDLSLQFPAVHWVKLRAVTDAAFETAEFAVKLAIGLIGIMALWLGLMQIIEKSGLILYLVKFVRPALSWLFPDIPKDHPALASISLNMTANILGLGNAATPLGIKAMQQLQALNHNRPSASDEMCMFLALNTSSVQLLPPVTLIALMGTQVAELIIPIILATSCSTLTAIIVARIYALKRKTRCNNSPH